MGPSPREREKEERKDRWEKKCPNLPPPAPTASAIGPCPTIIKIRTPQHWKFTQHHRTTRPPPEFSYVHKCEWGRFFFFSQIFFYYRTQRHLIKFRVLGLISAVWWCLLEKRILLEIGTNTHPKPFSSLLLQFGWAFLYHQTRCAFTDKSIKEQELRPVPCILPHVNVFCNKKVI